MQKQGFCIGRFSVEKNGSPLIIAEMSGNHNSSLERAMLIIEEAAKSGANAIKFQTYTADTITLDCKKKDFLIDDPHSLWHGKNLYDLYEEAHTPWEWHEPMFKRARESCISKKNYCCIPNTCFRRKGGWD